jgi:hypothetical protein
METNIKITKTKYGKYYISVKEYIFYIFPYWKKLTAIIDNKEEEVMLFDTKEEAKTFLDYIYMI